ncbi:hypothetical protein ONS95_011505 [Cadophora gregata]|uniref:uncharacterized protein n=1 Tax=Cadophora gregata TaxID=51156 RepID=UPI0026DD8D9E|nr:uncharacterized protein ONS95_011505 [Cadophora gregata]KAK0120092.1 hypothetical protein ONS95_011505 [Cadophora gregata]
MIVILILKGVAAAYLLLLPGFILYSPTSTSAKAIVTALLAPTAFNILIQPPTAPTALGTLLPQVAISKHLFGTNSLDSMKPAMFSFYHVFEFGTILCFWRYFQQKSRYGRINALKEKYGFTDDPTSWKDMTVEQAQEIESNMAEWEFPRLFQFAWISDFLRTSTDPGVSRALVKSGHMVNPDPMVEHDRLQSTVHLMSGMMAYKFRSANHSLVISRINEHHHRYGTWINSDDVLYLIIHFSEVPVQWISKFGYRKLEGFEVQAMWLLWRELGCSMGVKYIPETLEQAKEWRKNFETKCRWREDANEEAGMAMMNEIIYSVPSLFKPFVRKLIVSILDADIVYFCQMEKLGPSPVLRSIAYSLFGLCAWFIRNFCNPRQSPYKRAPDAPNNSGTWNFGHTPYDTLPFFQERSFWNLWGYGALFRRIYDVPLPSPKYFSEGIAIERMGALQNTPETQAAVETKVRQNAAILETALYGYRPAIGFQAGRLLPPVDGPSYGLDMNTFHKSTPQVPASTKRFEKQFERRSLGYSKLAAIEKPEDVLAFDKSETKIPKIDGFLSPSKMVKVSA